MRSRIALVAPRFAVVSSGTGVISISASLQAPSSGGGAASPVRGAGLLAGGVSGSLFVVGGPSVCGRRTVTVVFGLAAGALLLPFWPVPTELASPPEQDCTIRKMTTTATPSTIARRRQ